jgi:prepilin-type N-terminal cleavage/methylation domain-containing protein
MKKIKGFTLIELMIVVAIIGILAAIAIPKFADLIRKSNEGATKGNLGALRSAVSIYYGEQEGMFPSDTLAILIVNGKYIKEIPPCYTPNYHTSNNVVVNLTSATDTGQWGYNNNPAGGGKQYGDVWVNCTQTDTKSSTWALY